jgi:hypothetical protein
MQAAITDLSLGSHTTTLAHVRPRFLANPQLLTRV